MKMRVSAVLAVFLGVVALGAAEQLSPTFMWSGREHIAHRNGMVKDVVHEHDLTSMHRRFFRISDETGSRHAKLVSEEERPEVVAVFVSKEMSTEAVARHGHRMPGLKQRMERSTSSLTAPYTLAKNSVGSRAMWAHRLARETAELYGNDVVFTKTTAKRLPGSVISKDLPGFFHEKKHIMSNGNTELIVVELEYDETLSHEDNLEQQDKAITQATDAIEHATNGNFVAVVAAAGAANTDQFDALATGLYVSLGLAAILLLVLYFWVGSGVSLLFVYVFLFLVLVIVVYTNVSYVTTPIFTGIIAGVVITIIGGFGLINMARLQTPIRYEKNH